MRWCAPLSAVLTIVAVPALADAGGLDLDLLGAHGAARAGAITVSEDGAIALLVNPAGLARRGDLRAQIGTAIDDDDSEYRSSDPTAIGSPTITGRAGATAAPFGGFATPLGERLILGVTYAQTGDLSRALPGPELNQPVEQIVTLFPHRYGGTRLDYRRHTVAAGGAWRANSWLGVGLAVTGSWVELAERRRIWAGFASRDTIGYPTRDLDLELAGRDRVVPGLGFGFLIAPILAPLEIAASVSYRADAHLDGAPTLRATRATPYPQPVLDRPADRATLAAPLVVRTGVRYLGERLFVEATGELYWFAHGGAPTWQLSGLAVRDDSGRIGDLTAVVSLIDQRDHAAVRLAADYELVPGFLWLSAGAARRTAASYREAVSPIHGDLGGTTLGLGAEGQWNQMTLSIGYARTLTESVVVDPAHLLLVNPFDAGTVEFGAGRYRQAHDSFGAALEIAWE